MYACIGTEPGSFFGVGPGLVDIIAVGLVVGVCQAGIGGMGRCLNVKLLQFYCL